MCAHVRTSPGRQHPLAHEMALSRSRPRRTAEGAQEGDRSMRSREQQAAVQRDEAPLVPLREGLRATALPVAAITFWLAVGITIAFRLIPRGWVPPAHLLMEWSLWLFGIVIAWRQVRRTHAEREWRRRGGAVIAGSGGGSSRTEDRLAAVERRQDEMAETMANNERAWRDWNDINGEQPFRDLRVVPRAL